MTSARARFVAGLVLAGLALGAPLAQPHAEARMVMAPRCPPTHPQDGEACRRRDMSCSFPCSLPGEVDYTCTCTESDDGRLKWGCLRGHVCS